MELTYKNRKIERICSSVEVSDKIYGVEMSYKIHLRLDQIRASETVENLVEFRIGRCHPLSMNRKGQYAMDLVHPYRLIFEKVGDSIQIAKIIEIVDYH